ncbi:MAG TPA: hypothetical protein VMR89_12055 [Actinomycetota bacterium]|nr:hypothetical protein [Actinomycetota bacterium]
MRFEEMVGGIETWVGSLAGTGDQLWVEEWRRDWNSLEYVYASMIDEERDTLTSDERAIVVDALDHLEHMAERWTELDELERAVLEKLVAGDAPDLVKLQRQVAVCHVANREQTGHGFFTSFEVDPSEAEPIESGSARFGDVQAEIEGLEHGAGFLLFIANGSLDRLEGYSYEEPRPDVIGSFSLSYVKEPRDLARLLQPGPEGSPE